METLSLYVSRFRVKLSPSSARAAGAMAQTMAITSSRDRIFLDRRFMFLFPSFLGAGRGPRIRS